MMNNEHRIDETKFKKLISEYKDYIKNQDGLKNEIYKWELIAKYQGRPIINAEILNDIKSIDYNNLIFSQAHSMINYFIKNKPEKYKIFLKSFFDESQELQKRIEFFCDESLKIYKEVEPNTTNQSQHDERTAATFLTFKFPQKYTFYKNEVYKDLCDFLEIKIKVKPNCLLHYYEIVSELEKYIAQDSELQDIIKEKLHTYKTVFITINL